MIKKEKRKKKRKNNDDPEILRVVHILEKALLAWPTNPNPTHTWSSSNDEKLKSAVQDWLKYRKNRKKRKKSESENLSYSQFL